jgi:U3 small nucleolar RNA-associated protein 23
MRVTGPTNKHRYVLCANSFALRAWVRAEVPGVPVVHANERSVLVLEPISEKTRERIDNVSVRSCMPAQPRDSHYFAQLEVDKLRTDAHEASALGLSASSVAGSSRGATGDIVGLDAADAAEGSTPASAAAAAAVPGAKKRRAKEPNPLSMRKKKSAPTAAEAQQGAKSGEKRKRDDGAAPQGATATAAKDGAPARRRRKRGAGGSGAGGGGDDGAAKTTAEAAT